LSEVGARLSEIAGEVVRTHQRVNITHDGRSYVVLISAQDLESIEATLELLSDPESMARVAQADAHLSAGHQTGQTEMAASTDQRRQQKRPGA
jgi:antitoxin YefM